MKHQLITVVLLFISVFAAAQDPNPGMRELKESPIGWDKIMAPKGNYPGRQPLLDTFSNWIKLTYTTPVGGLPQEERVSLPQGSKPVYLPKGWAMHMNFWVPCYDKTGRGLTRAQPASADFISIQANNFYGREEANGFCTPAYYYFTMYYTPDGETVEKGVKEKLAATVNEVKQATGQRFVYVTNQYINILLSPEHRFPIVPVTQGELLQVAEEVINKWESPADVRKEQLEALQIYRHKYAGSQHAPALLRMAQLTVYSFDKDFELFVPGGYPLYKIAPAAYDAAKAGKTAFVSISFPYIHRGRSGKEIYKVMLHHFNYDYVYDYFFSPAKVKGKRYQPK
ncbi:hypothetical protein MKQ70_03935 [Chitinophaga sedimenti]|uniref:hypothetical protein n=1 Tax=Chitinophaga sedimenti TaxID=2033606 RepID=UPI002004F62E|nr:hypothetical protein [Chitinophaga sedimenti]MCK7554204.1 hypothetical protein [Chitinophaga sedimenti]